MECDDIVYNAVQRVRTLRIFDINLFENGALYKKVPLYIFDLFFSYRITLFRVVPPVREHSVKQKSTCSNYLLNVKKVGMAPS